jgi:hypothetical protein
LAGIAFDKQRIIRASKALKDGHMLANHDSNESTSQLVLRLHGSKHESGKALLKAINVRSIHPTSQS